MEGALTATDGAHRLKQVVGGCVVTGSFYKWPEKGKQLRMFINNGQEIKVLTTSKVTRVVSYSKVAMDFICEDGRFTLRMTGEKDSVMM